MRPVGAGGSMGVKRGLPAGKRAGPVRLPIMLSAFFFPGLGQCSQKRWGMGILYGGAFALLFGLFLFYCLRTVVLYYGMAWDSSPSQVAPSPMPVLFLFAADVTVYLFSLFDTYRAQLRINRDAAAKRHLERLDALDILADVDKT